ncbi:hypothetical protein HNV11_22865 [Spirosoma taeanense]|uniref:Uncharacterized protein n=1 Tax=Spirosoma taeanense TaxID=2735870 RepID=A0A6M5YFI0_9BACT|nr:hypothetical protein [Spirosoma taeanense]QJW92021.1 hypothetical protein HNV11_22865 [Spirosoma taeanense]
MRFVTVFSQLETCYAVGFDELPDAVDFLFWGYEEYELLPYGVYDVLTDEVTVYEHKGEVVARFDPEVITKTALSYLTNAGVRLKKA